MGRTASPANRRPAARYLAHARNELRFHSVKTGRNKIIPQPVFLEMLGEESEENIDSDSTSSSDTDTTLTDPDIEAYMRDAEGTQTGRPDISEGSASKLSQVEQTRVEHLSFIRDTAERMNLSEDLHGEGDDEAVEAFLYPDPITSELVPPPTPRLSHVDLPLPSIETDTPKGKFRETREDWMEECEGGDLSNIIHLLPANCEGPLFSDERHLDNNNTHHTKDVSMQDEEDGDVSNASPFSLTIDTSEMDALQPEPEDRDLSGTQGRVWDGRQLWSPITQNAMQAEAPLSSRTQSAVTSQTPGLGCVASHMDDFTEPCVTDLLGEPFPVKATALEEDAPQSMETVPREPEDMGLPDTPLPVSGPEVHTASLTKGFPKNHPLPTALNQIPGLGYASVHTNNFIGSSTTGVRNKLLPEQAPAAEPATHAASSEFTEEEEVPDRVLKLFMEDLEEMEANVLAQAESERRLLCRKHKALASDHDYTWGPLLSLATLRLEKRGVTRMKGQRPYTEKGLQAIRKVRKTLPPWKRHAVWSRSLLSVETRLGGDWGLFRSFHTGRGPTGGDPSIPYWRHCNYCGNGCKAV
jgi:hypothetical protein